jgi:hypothetical protein
MLNTSLTMLQPLRRSAVVVFVAGVKRSSLTYFKKSESQCAFPQLTLSVQWPFQMASCLLAMVLDCMGVS